MPLLRRNLKEVLVGERKIVRTINNVNLQCIPVKFSARVAQEVNYLLALFEDRKNQSNIAERRLKLELAAGLTGTILTLQWKCIDQTFQNSVYHYLHVDLCRQIVQRKKKRFALLARRDGFFKKQADCKIVSEYNQIFKDNPVMENRSLDGEDNISVLRALGRPSTGLPIEDAELTRFGNLAPPLMSTSLVPVVREYNEITNNLSVGLPMTSGVDVRYTIGEPSAILGIQAPDELLSYVEDVRTLSAEQSAPVEKVTHKIRNLKEEPVIEESAVANVTPGIQPAEQYVSVIENETTPIDNPVQVQNITSFVDITIDEMRVPYVQRTGQRALLADVAKINQVNRDQTLVPETPDSDIHHLLEPVIPHQVLRKKRNLIIDENTIIVDYSARAVRLTNQPRPIQNLFEKTNFNLKRLKITMSAVRLFKSPACSSLFNPMRASVLNKTYERHLLTEEMPTETIPFGVPVEANLIVHPILARHDNDESLLHNGEITNLSLPNRGEESRNLINIPHQRTLNQEPKTVGETSNIIADKSILPNDKQSAPRETLRDFASTAVSINKQDIQNPEIIRDSLNLVIPRNNINLIDNVPQTEQNVASAVNAKKTTIIDQFLNMVSIDKNSLIDVRESPVLPVDNVQRYPQQDTSFSGAQNMIDQSLNLMEVNRNNLPDVPHELMVPVGNVILDKIEHPETDLVNVSMQPPTFSLENNSTNNPPVPGQDFPISVSIIHQPPCVDEPYRQVTDTIPAINVEAQQDTRDGIRVIPIARLQGDLSTLHRGVANNEPVIPAIQDSDFETTVRPIFQPRNSPPKKEFRSEQYVMTVLKQNWEIVNMISITDILGDEHTLSNEAILMKTLLRLNSQWAVQLIKVYDTLAICPFPEHEREIFMSF